MRLLCLFLMLAVSAVPARAAIIHVPGDQPTIQAGIDAAIPGDVVLVAPGTYTGPGNKDLDFGNKDIEVRSEDGAAATIIDCQQSGRAFILHGTLTAAARVDGFTIRNGDGGGGDPAGGGGMLISGADPSIEDCLFTNNTAADRGGGIACHSSSSAITNCVFDGNSAVGFYPVGGGIAADASSITVTGCTFSQNSAAGGEGGGMLLVSPAAPEGDGGGSPPTRSVPTVSGCILTGNEAAFGGGISVPAGAIIENTSFVGNHASASAGGMMSREGTVAGCTFAENSAGAFGGGLEVIDSAVSGCTFRGNSAERGGGVWGFSRFASVTGCAFVGNSATVTGGGVNMRQPPGLFKNCTLVENWAPSGGGIYIEYANPPATIENTIIAFGAGGAAVSCSTNYLAALLCCDLYGNAGGDWAGCIAGQLGVNGNIAEDPLFCDRPAGDLSLCSDSPCAPAHSGGCGLIGARPVGCGDCGTTAVEPATWGEIKFRSRR